MTRHHIKCTKPVFNLIANGNKTAEVRFNDRLYQTGDVLIIYEGVDWEKTRNHVLKLGVRPAPSPSMKDTRRVVIAEISSVINGGQFGIEDGYVLLSFRESECVDYDDYINCRSC